MEIRSFFFVMLKQLVATQYSGHVISADLPRAAQLRPGDSVCFTETNLAEAHRLLRSQHDLLTTVQRGIGSKLGPAEKTS